LTTIALTSLKLAAATAHRAASIVSTAPVAAVEAQPDGRMERCHRRGLCHPRRCVISTTNENPPSRSPTAGRGRIAATTVSAGIEARARPLLFALAPLAGVGARARPYPVMSADAGRQTVSYESCGWGANSCGLSGWCSIQAEG
jgi:hypothetical protein